MKKILFVMPTLRMGGAEQSLISLLSYIDYEKYNVDLFLFEQNGELFSKIPQGVTLLNENEITKSMLLEFKKYYKILLRKGKFFALILRVIMMINSKIEQMLNRKLVYNWNISKHVIESIDKKYDVAIGYLEGVTDAFVIDKVNADRKIGWIHNDFSKMGRNFIAEEKYYDKFDCIAIISQECRDQFLIKYPHLDTKVEIVPNGINKQEIIKMSVSNKYDKRDISKFQIVTVGRLEHQKGIDIAIYAAQILKENNIAFEWHIYGEGHMRNNLQSIIDKLNLREFVYLNGITQNPYVYMKHADVVVQSSRYEGKSIVLDEAKLLARPIVVTNYPSVVDQIKNEYTGIIVGMSSEELALGILKIINNDVLRDQLIYNCKVENDITKNNLDKFYSILE